MAVGEDERSLIEGFLRRDPVVAAAFMAALLTRVRVIAFCRWPSLRHRVDEIEAEAVVLLARRLKDGKIEAADGIDALAQRLVTGAAVEERAMMRNDARRKEAVAAEPPPEAVGSAEARVGDREVLAGVWKALAGLSARHQAALTAQVAAEQGGPPLHVALGVEPATARKILERARQALLQRAIEMKPDLPDWLAAKGASRG